MSRLALKVNGGYLDLGNEVINLSLLNPALNDLQSHSLPFKIPLSKHNIELLGLLNERSYDEVIDYEAEIEGSWRFKGRLKLNKAGGRYEAVLRSGNGAFINLIKGFRLTDIEGSALSVGEDDGDVRTYLDAHVDDVYPTADYTAFIVSAPGYVPEEPGRRFNDYDNGFVDDADNLKPFVFVGKVLDLLFGQLGYAVENNCFRTNSDFQGYVLFHCNDIDWASADTDGWKAWLPDILVTDLLKTLRNRMNVVCYIDDINKTVDIRHFDIDIAAGYTEDITSSASFIKSIEFFNSAGFRLETDDDNGEFFDLAGKELSEVNEYENLPSASETSPVVLVKALDTYYKAVYDDGTSSWGWESFGSLFNKPEPRSDNTNISCGLNHMPNIPDAEAVFDNPPTSPIDYLRRLIPELTDNNIERITIMQYLGLIEEDTLNGVATPGDYPFGTMGYRDIKATQIADVSLAPDESAYGLRASYWPNTELWYSLRKKITRTVKYSPEFISGLRFYNKYRIDGQDYLINKIDIQLDFGNQLVVVKDSELITA